MELFEKTIAQDHLFEGRIVHLRRDTVRLPDDSTATREVVEHPGGVAMLPLTDDDHVLMVRQFRYPIGRVLLEIPAGKLERGEDPLACGIRELREEVGAIAGRIESLGKILPSPGYLTEVIHLYLATDLRFCAQSLDPGEFLEIARIPFQDALRKVMEGEIEDGKTQIALLKLWRMRG